jgi:hypothetical protein
MNADGTNARVITEGLERVQENFDVVLIDLAPRD